MAKLHSVQVTFYGDVVLIDSFKSRYPRLLSQFLRKCIDKANNDKQFFDSIYFDRTLDSADNNNK